LSSNDFSTLIDLIVRLARGSWRVRRQCFARCSRVDCLLVCCSRKLWLQSNS